MKQRVRETFDAKKRPMGYMIFCPACQDYHHLSIGYSYNGDCESPTFEEPILIAEGELNHRCHSHVRAGFIIYELDSTHPWRGRTMELPEVKG